MTRQGLDEAPIANGTAAHPVIQMSNAHGDVSPACVPHQQLKEGHGIAPARNGSHHVGAVVDQG